MTLLIVSLVILLIFGVPIAYSLGLSSFLYFVVHHPELISVIPQRFYAGMDAYLMIALPLFIAMGCLMNESGITRRLINFSLLFVGRFRGGLGLVNIVASMIFGGISGSSVSDTASVGAVLIPEMEEKGYSKEFSSGITVASSTMGMIIPPSIPVVIYALVAEASVGKLFLGTAIPGIMIGLLMIIITLIISHIKKHPKEEVNLSKKEILITVQRSVLAVIMPLFIIGAVVFGITTATESAAIGVLYALIIGAAVFRTVGLKSILRLMRKAILTSATVMIIIALSKIYIWILALEHVPQMVAAFITGLDVPVFLIIIFVDLIILFIGTFIDVSPAILLLTPVFLPAMQSLGVDAIQFGAILISGLALGLVTPPVGMCLNVASAISGLGIGKIFKGALPFLLANIITLILISFVKPFTLWLPELFMK
ncbi:MAG TPA: TRAP transporter large permease [Clostridia bacterium]|nr:TRAP transporter large permease [Clostridia bacterium]